MSAVAYPGGERGDFVVRERFGLLGRRHFVPADALDEVTFVGLSGHDHRAGFAPLQGGFRGCQVKLAFGLTAVVTAQAVANQDWCDAVIEIGFWRFVGEACRQIG